MSGQMEFHGLGMGAPALTKKNARRLVPPRAEDARGLGPEANTTFFLLNLHERVTS